MQTKSTLSTEIANLLADADSAIRETMAFLISQGEVVDLAEWVTIKEYCQRFNIKNIETVINWINRGFIPADHIRVIEELNNIRLIKAVPYQVKSAKTA